MILRNKLLKDASLLLGGNVINAGCQLATTLLLANALPAADWGAIAVIISYVLVTETLFATKNWQLVSSHAYAYLDKTPRRFGAHFSTFFTAELITNLLATFFAVLLLPTAMYFMNLPPDYFLAGCIYSTSILFRFSGSAGAILRLSNKYLWQSTHAATLGIARLAGISSTLYVSQDPAILLTCLAVIESIWHIGLASAAWIILKQRGVLAADLTRNIVRRLKNQNWTLVATSHFTNLVKVATRELDVLFVSAFSGPDSAGVIKVLKSILRSVLILSDPLANAAFPRFIAFQNQDNIASNIRKLLRTLIVFGSAIATAALAAISIVIALFWAKFSNLPIPTESGYFLTYAMGIWIAVTFFCLPPANLALKRYSYALKLNCILAALYVTGLLSLIPLYGATGAGIAFAITQTAWAASYLSSFKTLARSAT